jgi:hypothetical protein
MAWLKSLLAPSPSTSSKELLNSLDARFLSSKMRVSFMSVPPLKLLIGSQSFIEVTLTLSYNLAKEDCLLLMAA